MRSLSLGVQCAVFAGFLTSGCAHQVGKDPKGSAFVGDGGDMDAAARKNTFGNADSSKLMRDGARASFPSDAEVTADAFFVNDPPPPICGEDGGMQTPPTPTGTPDCPSDKNREGCPCPSAGMTASCWPGKRLNRDHGICKDGMTKCADSVEFGLRWGPCEGYVLPVDGALVGPDACRCFSSGTWKVDDLRPCLYTGASGSYLYSGRTNADGSLNCGANVPDPPPTPQGSWTADAVNVDCSGQFRLCYTIKAGSIANPSPNDCVITQQCVDVWYPNANTDQKLPDLPAWISSDKACAAKFLQSYGYGEMSVIGKSGECDVVDDGHGNPYVFHRTDYCPPSCESTPNAPECQGCQAGGSGMFGQ